MANPISPKPTADEGVEMSEILRPCPFCGGTKICTEKGINLNYCDNCSAESNVEHWNNRPIEDALNARIAELEEENAALKAKLNAGETVDEWGKPDWVGKDVRK